jgi:hypothetical protein
MIKPPFLTYIKRTRFDHNRRTALLWCLTTLFFLTGCSEQIIIEAQYPTEVFRVPPNATITWDDQPIKSLPPDQQYVKDGKQVRIINDEIVGDEETTTQWGWYICDDKLNEAMDIKVEEKARKTWGDRIWESLGF